MPKVRRYPLARLIFEAVAAAPDGLTCAEFVAQTGGKHQTISPRFNELRAAGCIRDSGKVRNTELAVRAVVYEVVPDAPFERFLQTQQRKAQLRWEKRHAKKDNVPLPTPYTMVVRNLARYIRSQRMSEDELQTNAFRAASILSIGFSKLPKDVLTDLMTVKV